MVFDSSSFLIETFGMLMLVACWVGGISKTLLAIKKKKKKLLGLVTLFGMYNKGIDSWLGVLSQHLKNFIWFLKFF